ncbi:2-oxoisovalerate dehydrogenase subunit alpha 2 mitochondrial [Bienertia sinuspersici]
MAVFLRRSRNIMKHLYFVTSTYNSTTHDLITNSTIPSFLGIANNNAFGKSSVNFGRLESTKAAELKLDSQLYSSEDDELHDPLSFQGMDFPGGKVMLTTQMSFIAESGKTRVPCYRVLDDCGEPIYGTNHELVRNVNQGMATRMYSSMVKLQVMDNYLYEAQRQGRISFYVTSHGEEAINIASAAALSPDDIVFAQYREPGVLLWRGFSLQEFANQCFGNKADYGKGRQMPIHYGSSTLNYFTISSPIATQLPQAAGAAYSLKMDDKDACVVAYMGDGSTSEHYATCQWLGLPHLTHDI